MNGKASSAFGGEELKWSRDTCTSFTFSFGACKATVGFTWSFFTHKDPQDCHAHNAPVVEIYGILEGCLETWWKTYYDRGTSGWSHRLLDAGDWLEVDSLQCHIVHWLTEGKGVVFKAGPGPLAEVGKLGVKGKTPCDECPCMKPKKVKILEVARGKQ